MPPAGGALTVASVVSLVEHIITLSGCKSCCDRYIDLLNDAA